MKFVPAVAYHFCLSLPETFSQPCTNKFSRLCTHSFLSVPYFVEQLTMFGRCLNIGEIYFKLLGFNSVRKCETSRFKKALRPPLRAPTLLHSSRARAEPPPLTKAQSAPPPHSQNAVRMRETLALGARSIEETEKEFAASFDLRPPLHFRRRRPAGFQD